ncbi:MAG: hypothetical protein ABIC95_06260 [archaeon]
MKTLIVIPTYWSHENYGLNEQKLPVFDHPTPVNSKGTFIRTLESLKILKDTDFDVLVIASAVSAKVMGEMYKKIKKELIEYTKNSKIKLYLLSRVEVDKFKKIIKKNYQDRYNVFLHMKGYSPVRNLSLIAAQILDAEILISIDDDEIITDPDFLFKAKEFIGKEHNGKMVDGIAGYYTYENNRINLIDKKSKWRSSWNQVKLMNAAFDQFIKKGPRLKEAHWMLGGCSVIHRNLFTKIPFDIRIPRGEDIDYLINSKMWGFNIFFDRKIFIKHTPSPSGHPLWKMHRTDIYRFIYQRQKIRQQRTHMNMVKVETKNLAPYTSAFIGKNLDSKIERSCKIMAEQYMSIGDSFSALQCLENAKLASQEHLPKYNVFDQLLLLKKKWVSFSKVLEKKEIKSALKKCLLEFR